MVGVDNCLKEKFFSKMLENVHYDNFIYIYIYNFFVMDRVRVIFDEFLVITKFACNSNLTYPNLT